MKVSVIVLTYNQEDTISRTLDSILAQQVDFDYEIIVGDDASTDRTRQICTQYQQRHPDRLRIMP
ncbi:MAG: glycosyltransferase family 2 protein, partial [Muribaculaceae bacterium]|nr:glycosyltransferase family 2 protein [Muribaculaceae bacterium]